MKKITLLFRKPDIHQNSIEELFTNIYNGFLKEGINVRRLQVPNNRSNPLTIFRNVLFVRKNIKEGVLHITGDIHYTAIFSRVPVVLTIHDTKSILKGSFPVRVYKYIFWFFFPSLFLDHITTISKQTFYEVSRLIPFYGKKNISIVPNPVNTSLFKRLKKMPFQGSTLKNYVLHIGTKENKNLERTAYCISKLKKKLTLLIVGNLSSKQIIYLHSISGLTWKNLANLSYQQIIWLYQNAVFMSFISTYEGFGMPILEAQATGTPIVTSNISPMKDIAGKGAILVNPYDQKSIVNGYRTCLLKENVHRLKIEAGENIKRFKIESIIRMYMNIYSIIN